MNELAFNILKIRTYDTFVYLQLWSLNAIPLPAFNRQSQLQAVQISVMEVTESSVICIDDAPFPDPTNWYKYINIVLGLYNIYDHLNDHS